LSAAPHPEAAPTAQAAGGNGQTGNEATAESTSAAHKFVASQGAQPPSSAGAKSSVANSSGGSQNANGHRPVDFVCEDDVRQALQRGEKIYITARTIITPAAHDIGDAAEVFAKV
nr:hypothetical protein [Pyrinomonadaceae bacterium]